MDTNEFAALTQDEQIANLERLGRNALAEFGVEPEEINRLVHAENTTFRVESQQGRFNLRISRPGYQTTANIQSEIQFLAALRAENFRVPDPWQSRLIRASGEGVPEARDCVLFKWMDGEFAKPRITPHQAFLVGQTMAKLHEFSCRWKAPEGFERRNIAAIFDPTQDPPIESVPTSMALPEDRDLVYEVKSKFWETISSLPRDLDWYGLIHSDLHHGNILFEGEVVNVIDFDDTQWSFWISDFSAALAYALPSDDYPEIRSSMLDGYVQVRPLPPGTESLLDLFLRARLASIAAWVMSRSDNPTFRETGHQWVSSMCSRIRSLQSQ